MLTKIIIQVNFSKTLFFVSSKEAICRKDEKECGSHSVFSPPSQTHTIFIISPLNYGFNLTYIRKPSKYKQAQKTSHK